MNILLLLFFIILIYIIYDFFKKNRNIFIKNKESLPSPLALPIIGHLNLLLFTKGKLAYEVINGFAKKYNNGLYCLWVGDFKTVFISDPKLIKEVMVTRLEEFADRPDNTTLREFSGDNKSLIFSNYSRWKPLRNRLSSIITKYKVKKSNFIIENQTKVLINSFNKFSNKPFSPNKLIYRLTTNVIFEMLFSKKISDGNEEEEAEEVNFDDKSDLVILLKSLEYVSEKISYGSINELIWFLKPFYYFINKDFLKYLEIFYTTTEKFYNQHKLELDQNDNKPKDLMDLLIEAGEDKDSIIHISKEVLIAGSDTTLAVVQWFLLFMANYPEIQQKGYDELIKLFGKDCKFINADKRRQCDYFNAIIKEIIRIRIPVPLTFPRVPIHDTYLNSYFISKDTQLVVNIYGLANNTDLVENSNAFRPERWIEYYKAKEEGHFKDNDEYYNNLDKLTIPFSTGIKNCFGVNIAESTVFTVCSNILLNYSIFSPDGKKMSYIGDPGVAIQPKAFEIKLVKRFN